MTTRAETFAALHRPGDPLLLPNAWDVGSAAAIAAAGARAIATTSAGVAWSLGFADGADLGADRNAALVERIAATVDVPVSADIEAGYGAVAESVAAVVRAGAVGVNLEDRVGADLLPPAEQADRLRAARAAADRLGVPVWINARTDVYLAGSGRLEEVLERAEAYAAAGASSLFVPGLIDLEALKRLSDGPLPVAVMAWAGAPSVAEFAAAGVVRISLGSSIAQAAYALAARATTELLEKGVYDATADGLPYGELNALLG
ncbi:isocitrate lyase/phosphoenolpyruvate mutase family protein [Nonomuraea sp. NPDC050310]|uniref:isocitrate lyase/phosphoenolpyruvate mutase family protein n=1 Tax=unclassified Nonomuraea TaxID=2593643 RepID=UPI0033D3D1EB